MRNDMTIVTIILFSWLVEKYIFFVPDWELDMKETLNRLSCDDEYEYEINTNLMNKL